MDAVDIGKCVLRVMTAAISLDGVIWTLPRPARHHDVVRHMVASGCPAAGGMLGFVLSDGRFALRKAAAQVAARARQITELRWPPNLYSEDLW